MLHLKWHKKEIRNIFWGGLASLLFLFSQNAYSSPLKIAILDTGFCIDKLTLPKNLKIHKSIDLTNSNNFKCSKLDSTDRRLHGNWVLNQFIKEIKKDLSIEITPFIVFDKYAKQDTRAWLKALEVQEKFHLFIIAAGIKDAEKLNPIQIRTPLFIAGATIGRGIGYKTILWPQNQFKNSFVFTIGSYSEANEDLPIRPDYTLINPSQMKYFFKAGNKQDHFQGTSRATATASARAVNHCYSNLTNRNNVEACLKNHSKIIELSNDKEKVKVLTF